LKKVYTPKHVYALDGYIIISDQLNAWCGRWLLKINFACSQHLFQILNHVLQIPCSIFSDHTFVNTNTVSVIHKGLDIQTFLTRSRYSMKWSHLYVSLLSNNSEFSIRVRRQSS